MEGAIEELSFGRMGYLLAAKSLYVPQSTLESRVIKARTNQLTSEKAATNGGMYFPNHKKKELVEHILLLESRLFGLTLTDIRRLAYNLGNKNKLNHNFNDETQMARPD
ncbi:hypothetical protein AVEN_109781-1 [Araneus ventricosus]|uniref:HTH psq-type domain-containing protein n=1 Tax=Araneus ventricosus TaxID=182803 RepID=A0A4Y2VW64_ARAVE|nr:hypothetical protein AVEN_109781-1 [Araneus ventricosus]